MIRALFIFLIYLARHMGAQKTHGEVSLLTVMFRQDVLQELTASTVVGSLSCSKIKVSII